jgi:hypothetical protein
VADDRPNALVIFGITGDLPRQMTFQALYRPERRGKLPRGILGIGRGALARPRGAVRGRGVHAAGAPVGWNAPGQPASVQ